MVFGADSGRQPHTDWLLNQQPYVLTNLKNQENGWPFVGRRDGECRAQPVAKVRRLKFAVSKKIEEQLLGRFFGPVTLAVWVPGMMSSYEKDAFFNIKNENTRSVSTYQSSIIPFVRYRSANVDHCAVHFRTFGL